MRDEGSLDPGGEALAVGDAGVEQAHRPAHVVDVVGQLVGGVGDEGEGRLAHLGDFAALGGVVPDAAEVDEVAWLELSAGGEVFLDALGQGDGSGDELSGREGMQAGEVDAVAGIGTEDEDADEQAAVDPDVFDL